MKIRNGFVSNSSTASFLIKIKEDKHPQSKEKDFVATEEDIQKLIGANFSFVESRNSCPFFFEPKNKSKKRTKEHTHLYYYVTCNEYSIIYDLVKNNIPFRASGHYDNYYVSYRKDSDFIFFARNFGVEFEMYGEDKKEEIYKYMKEYDYKPFEKIEKEQWLEDEKLWEDDNIFDDEMITGE